jgi:hypothetical protein
MVPDKQDRRGDKNRGIGQKKSYSGHDLFSPFYRLLKEAHNKSMHFHDQRGKHERSHGHQLQ